MAGAGPVVYGAPAKGPPPGASTSPAAAGLTAAQRQRMLMELKAKPPLPAAPVGATAQRPVVPGQQPGVKAGLKTAAPSSLEGPAAKKPKVGGQPAPSPAGGMATAGHPQQPQQRPQNFNLTVNPKLTSTTGLVPNSPVTYATSLPGPAGSQPPPQLHPQTYQPQPLKAALPPQPLASAPPPPAAARHKNDELQQLIPPPQPSSQGPEEEDDGQDFDELTDVTKLAGVNLKEEENFYIAGQDEAQGLAYEDERDTEFVDMKALRSKVMAIALTKKGLKDVKPEAIELLAHSLEEWIRDAFDQLIRLSKHRGALSRTRFHTVITSDLGKDFRERLEKEKRAAIPTDSIAAANAKQTAEQKQIKKEQERIAKQKQEEEERQRTNAAAFSAIGDIRITPRKAPPPTAPTAPTVPGSVPIGVAVPGGVIPKGFPNPQGFPQIAIAPQPYLAAMPMPGAGVPKSNPALRPIAPMPPANAPAPTTPFTLMPQAPTLAPTNAAPAVAPAPTRTIGTKELVAFLHRDPWLRHSTLYYRLLCMPPAS